MYRNYILYGTNFLKLLFKIQKIVYEGDCSMWLENNVSSSVVE